MLSQASTPNCPICRKSEQLSYPVNILRKYSSNLWTCVACDFSHLHPVFWLKEAYAEPINVSDVGYIFRNNMACQLVSSLLRNSFEPDDLFLDFGAGYGMFVRLMRDHGFRFQYYDPSCTNLFSRFNEATLDGSKRYKLATAMEVIEHTVDPIATILNMFEYTDNILLSTEISPTAPPSQSWWYLGLEHGQHISFFGARTFSSVAERLSVKYSSPYPNWHFLSKADFRLGTPKGSRIRRLVYRLLQIDKEPAGLMMRDFDTTRVFLDNPELADRFGNSIDEYEFCGRKPETEVVRP